MKKVFLIPEVSIDAIAKQSILCSSIGFGGETESGEISDAPGLLDF